MPTLTLAVSTIAAKGLAVGTIAAQRQEATAREGDRKAGQPPQAAVHAIAAEGLAVSAVPTEGLAVHAVAADCEDMKTERGSADLDNECRACGGPPTSYPDWVQHEGTWLTTQTPQGTHTTGASGCGGGLQAVRGGMSMDRLADFEKIEGNRCKSRGTASPRRP